LPQGSAGCRSHWGGIAVYCKPENKVSLGFAQGLNNKIGAIQRRATACAMKDTFASRLSVHAADALTAPVFVRKATTRIREDSDIVEFGRRGLLKSDVLC
jgi:hypothetical protein